MAMTQTSLSDFHAFADGMERLKTRYPNHRPTQSEFTNEVQEYYRCLKRYPIKMVLRAMMSAPEASKGWFPTTGELIGLTKDHLRGEKSAGDDNRARAQEERAADRDRAYYRDIPHTPGGMKAHIEAAGDNPFEKAARVWECETRVSGRDPAGVTPDDVFRNRMRVIRKLLAASPIGRGMTETTEKTK